jgi:hypothetical protein
LGDTLTRQSRARESKGYETPARTKIQRLEELLTHSAIAILAKPAGVESVVNRALHFAAAWRPRAEERRPQNLVWPSPQGFAAYDAAYLDLAAREKLELATLDAAMRRAAEQSGIAIFQR